MLVWLSVWSEVQILCIWSSCCHCLLKTLSSLAWFKSRLVLPFWYWLTQLVLEKRPLNRCSSSSSSSMLMVVCCSDAITEFMWRRWSSLSEKVHRWWWSCRPCVNWRPRSLPSSHGRADWWTFSISHLQMIPLYQYARGALLVACTWFSVCVSLCNFSYVL